MNPTLKAFVRHFKSKDLKHDLDKKNEMIQSIFSLDNGQYTLHIHTSEEKDYARMLVHIPLKVSNTNQLAICEAITRANFGIIIGNFELDMEEGYIYYRNNFLCTPKMLTEDFIDENIGRCLTTTDRYFPAFTAICHQNQLPETAVYNVETDEHDALHALIEEAERIVSNEEKDTF